MKQKVKGLPFFLFMPLLLLLCIGPGAVIVYFSDICDVAYREVGEAKPRDGDPDDRSWYLTVLDRCK